MLHSCSHTARFRQVDKQTNKSGSCVAASHSVLKEAWKIATKTLLLLHTASLDSAAVQTSCCPCEWHSCCPSLCKSTVLAPVRNCRKELFPLLFFLVALQLRLQTLCFSRRSLASSWMLGWPYATKAAGQSEDDAVLFFPFFLPLLFSFSGLCQLV